MLLKVICDIYGDEAVFTGNPELQVLWNAESPGISKLPSCIY